MPDRPDYSALTRGQIAILDRINAGETGLPVLQQVVRLAQEALGGRGAGFAEYAPDHGRIIAATGACTPAIGRRVDRADSRLRGRRSLLIPLDSLNDEFAKHVEGGDLRRMLGARCEGTDDAIVGSLHVYFGDGDGEPGPEHHAVLELLAAHVGRLYAARAGLPVHSTSRQDDRDLWVAVTSHELRTPVTVIKGYADTLTNHWDSLGEDGRQEAVRVIGTRAGELARLVDRLLSAASADGEIGGAPAGPFDLPETLRHAVDELPADLRRRMLLGNLPAELPKAYGERDSIATILTELTTNAGKYSPPDSLIELCAGADEETLRFRVSDRGVGIRPEHVERAFERYWQGDTGDRQHHPGAGLGLYLVRRLVERQHGWVSLRPREGGGTTAEVRLPRA
ncbi:PAS domain-containing sensor histidine kinase [Paractinoplanes deccanensis]|uniref:histidine kinase n=1 Tax=Paractinoplanes deccanensis TaxID=113561 RepID=A0ABQ3YG88_9ACTN|nr:HAMP domain-containing sensor histidine kinase [Actinoplanes deccanensis]GID79023.1 PAS domain-containing sensor histidine kinase [Actinoplanes deccanensis]